MEIEKLKHCHCGNVIFNENADFCSTLCEEIVTGNYDMNQDLPEELLNEIDIEDEIPKLDLNDDEQWKIFLENFKKELNK